MNVTLPDNATIQIFVVPPGGSAAVDPETGTPRLLLAAPVRKASRRRDVLFVGAGIALAIGVLSVVRIEQNKTLAALQPAHAAYPSARPETYPLPLQPLSQPVPAPIRAAPDRADYTPSGPDADPREAVRQTLAGRATVTPPPGAAAAVPNQQPGAPDGSPPGKRNAFGMTD